MYRLILVFVLAFCAGLPSPYAAATPDSCARLEQERQRIYQQLRRAHGIAAANRLHARLRELNSRIAHECR